MNTPDDPRNGSPFGRMVRLGLWALPAWAVLRPFIEVAPGSALASGAGPVVFPCPARCGWRGTQVW